jgi:hypothetical protein
LSDETVNIRERTQYKVHNKLDLQGSIEIEPEGELVVFLGGM